MGKVAKVSRLVVILAVEGSSTLLSAESTSCKVVTMLTFQLKKRSTSAEPRLVVERTEVNPGTELTPSSIGLVMLTSICSMGVTPLSTPMTTRGKLVSGKTDMGTFVAMKMPATVSTMAKKKMVRVERASQKLCSCAGRAEASWLIPPCLQRRAFCRRHRRPCLRLRRGRF